VIKTCVIGWPIAHSRSPLIHGYWIAKYGLDASYTKQAVAPDGLEKFLQDIARNGYAGCNVTLPHKEAACQLVDDMDELARRLGAVNTVSLKNGRLIGTNTDGEGFVSSLRASHPDFILDAKKAVIVGAGGSARAVAGALLDEGFAEIAVANRTASRIVELKAALGPRLCVASHESLAQCDLLVHATSQGMEGQPPLEFDVSVLKASCIVADLIYAPLKTSLVVAAETRGHRVLPGLGMLLHQAVRGFELWHGLTPEVTPELADLVATDITGRRLA
jgi:shikimate dehydrogenase